MSSLSTLWAKPLLKVAVFVALCAAAIALAWPPPTEAQPRTWLDLISPLAPGKAIGDAYQLSPPRRGEERDIVFMARHVNSSAAVELHIVPKGQWADALNTASFGVSYEEPRSTAPPADAVRLVKELAQALAANDPGGLTTVGVPLTAQSPPPPLPRALRQLTGARGYLWALCVLLAAMTLVTLPRGALWLALGVFALALLVRVPHLDLPFLWDQDVQRLQIGASDVTAILSDVGLHDRHPPLYFLVLHVAQWFGQVEQTVRLPAAIFGALTAPALVYAVWRVHGKITALAAVAAVVAALSPVLIRHSREVGEITFFGLLLVLLATAATRFAGGEGRRRDGVLLAGLCAAALWTYYLAGFALVACAAAAWWLHRPARRFWLWFGAGVALGAPSLALGYRALVADRTARAVAAAQPGVAWGARDAAEVFRGTTAVLAMAIGGLLVLFVAAAVWSIGRRKPLGAMAGAMAIGLPLAVVGLAPFARIQPYYVTVAIPLMLLTIAAAEWPPVVSAPRIVAALAAGLGVLFVGAQVASVSSAYVAEDGALMPRFAATITSLGDDRVATVAHYDTTLLAYYLARQQGVVLRSDRTTRDAGNTVRIEGLRQLLVPLVHTHAPNQDPDWLALSRLRTMAHRQPVLLVVRDAVRLPHLEGFLANCEIIEDAAVARLLRCRHQDLVPRPRPTN